MNLVLCFAFLLTACCGSAQIQKGALIPAAALHATLDSLNATERCREYMLDDLAIAQQLVHIPMNGYDLYDGCSVSAETFSPLKDAESAFIKATRRKRRGVAILMMVHSCKGLGHLLRRLLADSKVHVAVHIDRSAHSSEHDCVERTVRSPQLSARQPESPSSCSLGEGPRQTAEGGPHVHRVTLLHPQTDVEWGSWSMTEVEITAMRYFVKKAAKGSFKWTHFLVTSGADYPLASASDLVDFFSRKQLRGKSFYYENEMDDTTRRLTLTELVSSCGGSVVHLGYRADVPPPEYFVFSNTWKFFAWEFVSDFIEGRHGLMDLFSELSRLLHLTPSADEVTLPTLHKHSMVHCRQRAPIHPRDFYTIFWPGDDVSRTCSPTITGSPVEWYCPKRPFSLDAADFPRIPIGISLFTRKVAGEGGGAALRELIDAYIDEGGSAGGVPHFSNTGLAKASNGVAIRLEGDQHDFAVRFLDDRRAATGQQRTAESMLWWGWIRRDPRHRDHLSSSVFILSDCTGGPAAAVRQGGCFVSGQVAGFPPTFCRLRLRAQPELCLTLHSETVKVGGLVGLSTCGLFLEPQLYSFQDGRMVSSSKVSLTQYSATKGLCVTRDPKQTGVTSTPILPCGSRETQAVCARVIE
eukprot:TRINITY_DN1631_c0_g2_i1.p1 TRINITY_DN1631_c0_g2~~TRINITY_DN1631_c0_g2_i1.p1  ORF type:complete len:638 (+),score=53.34 TRINITY_DN1631_c0_g2_i1:84-1997(+)